MSIAPRSLVAPKGPADDGKRSDSVWSWTLRMEAGGYFSNRGEFEGGAVKSFTGWEAGGFLF